MGRKGGEKGKGEGKEEEEQGEGGGGGGGRGEEEESMRSEGTPHCTLRWLAKWLPFPWL